MVDRPGFLKLFPLEPEKKLPNPLVFAAFGMASSYYSYPLLVSSSPGIYPVLGLLILLVIAVSFLRVLRYFPGENFMALGKIGIFVIAGAVGFSLGIASRRTVSGQAELGLTPERVNAVSGILREDPRTLHGGSGLGILELRECAAGGAIRSSARGNLVVFFPAESIPRLREFGRGCEIYADGVYSSSARGPMFRASSVHIVKSAGFLETFRTAIRMKLLERFQSRAAPVWGGLASALLLGVRDDLDVELSDGFRNSGCSHILALSGMHLAIISGILAFLLKRPLGVRLASLTGALFIVVYIFVAGSQPSLVRAGIMYLIGTFALWGLLKGSALSLLCMAFIIQLLFQSGSGVSVSFILSYLALGGILTLGETIRSLFKGRLPEIIAGSLSSSLGAFVATAPVVALFFGTLRPVGIIAGLLLAPLSSLFMVFAIGALASSFLPFPLWNIFDLVLTWIYRFLEFLVSMAGAFPGFSVSNPVWVLVFSIIFWILILFIRKHDMAYRDSVASFY
jgi:competence protein ComEC